MQQAQCCNALCQLQRQPLSTSKKQQLATAVVPLVSSTSDTAILNCVIKQ
jgi:hypothetical protein